MKNSSKRIGRENRDLFNQARNSAIYWLLENDSEDKLSLPINTNTLQFQDEETSKKFLKTLYFDDSSSTISKEFKQNLIIFFVYLSVTLLLIIASVSALYDSGKISLTSLIFNVLSSSTILLSSYLLLVLLLKRPSLVHYSQTIFTTHGLIFTTYAILSHKTVMSFLGSSSDEFSPIPFSLIICSFVYFFRLLQFDNFRSVLILSSYTICLFLVLQVSLSSSNIQDKLIEYSFLLLFFGLNTIESYRVNSRTALIFYRLYYEEIKNEQFETNHPLANAEFVSGSELIIEKCDQIINVIRHTKKLIMFQDVRDRLKFSIKLLNSIRKYLGRSGINNEFINISETAKIDDQDKQFIAQNFLSITKFYPEKSYSRNLTLKDLLKKKPRFSLSMRVLEDGSEILDTVGTSWNLDLFDLSEKFGGPVGIIGKHFFYKWGISDLLSGDREVFFRFFENLEIVIFKQNYNENPYHNSKHAACVFNSFLCLVSNSKLENLMPLIESVVSMIACLAHDIGHPGVTNRYLVSSRNELALRYNDMSVLENMHCAMVYKLLSDPNYNIFASLKHSEWSNCRKLMIEMILNTDMSKHFETISRFRMRNSSLRDLNEEIMEDRTAILSICLKCADLGHSAKTFELHEKWTDKVCEEFFLQGDLEKENGLAVSMYCDRDNTDVAKSQAGFIRNICIPLFLVFYSYSQAEFVERECIQQLYNNLNHWEERSKEKHHLKDH